MYTRMHAHTIRTTTRELAEAMDYWAEGATGLQAHYCGGRDWVLTLMHANHPADADPAPDHGLHNKRGLDEIGQAEQGAMVYDGGALQLPPTASAFWVEQVPTKLGPGYPKTEWAVMAARPGEDGRVFLSMGETDRDKGIAQALASLLTAGTGGHEAGSSTTAALRSVVDGANAYNDAVAAYGEVVPGPLSTTIGWVIRQGHLKPARAKSYRLRRLDDTTAPIVALEAIGYDGNATELNRFDVGAAAVIGNSHDRLRFQMQQLGAAIKDVTGIEVELQPTGG